jgi:DNA polymerase-3 subunit alpha
MKQEKKLKNYCKEMLLDFYIDSNYLTIEGKDYLIVDGDELIFDSEFNFAPELNLELEEDTFGFVYEFGGIWYTQQVGAEISMSELKNTGKADQKLSTEIFLGIHSGNEMLNGIGMYKDWIKKAKFLGVKTLGICEKNTLAGAMSFQTDCKKSGIKSIIGMTLSVNRGSFLYEAKLYAKDFQGWLNLLKFSEVINVQEKPSVDESFLLENLEGVAFILDPKTTNFELKPDISKVYMLDTVMFENSEIDKDYLNNLEKYLKSDLEPIAIYDAYCIEKDDWQAREVLWGIAKKFDFKTKNQYFKNNDQYAKELIEMFESEDKSWIALFKKASANLSILEVECNFKYDTQNRRLPTYKMTEKESSEFSSNEEMFIHLIKQGLKDKKVKNVQLYVDRLKIEIDVLKKGDVIDYFLIQRDIINEASRKGMLTGIGRGSAGGSLVSYLLGIIQINPMEFDLLFERFLNIGRMGEFRECDAFEIETDQGIIKLNEGSLIKIVRNEKETVIFVEQLLEGDEIINL